MGAMWMHDPRMMMPVQHLPEYVQCTEVPHEATSKQASQYLKSLCQESRKTTVPHEIKVLRLT